MHALWRNGETTDMTYSSIVTIDITGLLPAWKSTMDELNATMRSFGVEEKVVARSEIGTFTIQSPTELPADKLEEVRAKAEAIARESQPEWDFRFGRLELL